MLDLLLPFAAPGKGGANIGAIVGIFLLVFIILGAAGWFWYAYRYPTTASGMCLMTVSQL
jgi:hypothetical protein